MSKLTFGDADTGVWGLAWQGAVWLGTREAAARLEAGDLERDWRLVGDGVELSISPAAEAVGGDQLCRVTGRFDLDDITHPVDSLGRRGTDGALETFQSARDISAWFEPDRGLALVSLRPANARGHEGDVVTAAVLDAGGAGPVADPRLSTTYAADGKPLRAGLELWLSDGEHEFPLRAAGESTGASVQGDAGGYNMRAELLRWHCRGLDGAGVYVLARRA